MDSNTRQILTAIRGKKELIAMGYEKLSINDANVKSLTVPDTASYAEIRVESDVTASVPLRYLMLGATTPPTATNGLALNHLDFFDIPNGDNIRNFRVIRTSAGTHTLHVQYYK